MAVLCPPAPAGLGSGVGVAGSLHLEGKGNLVLTGASLGLQFVLLLTVLNRERNVAREN